MARQSVPSTSMRTVCLFWMRECTVGVVVGQSILDRHRLRAGGSLGCWLAAPWAGLESMEFLLLLVVQSIDRARDPKKNGPRRRSPSSPKADPARRKVARGTPPAARFGSSLQSTVMSFAHRRNSKRPNGPHGVGHAAACGHPLMSSPHPRQP